MNTGLGADEAVVLSMGADPEPVNARLTGQTECPVMEPYSCAVQLATAQQLELERRVRWVVLEELEVLVRHGASIGGERFVAAPEPRRGCVIHNARGL